MGYWIVVVDDEPLSLKNAKLLLSTQDMRVSCLRSGADLLKFLEKNTPDLILLDVLMPEMDGFQTLSAVRSYQEQNRKPWIPIIFLTGENDYEVERRGLGAGASDFIHKPFDRDILIRRITNTIESIRKIENLTEEASIDKLTGFLNKASGTSKVADLCSKETGALLLLDLDNFKLVNDLFGHDMGDKVLVAFSNVIRHSVRMHDTISRIGGDEFMIFCPQLVEEDAVSSLTDRLNSQLMVETSALMGVDHGVPLGISIGAAFAPAHSNDYQTLFQFADTALYKTKQNGKHGYTVHDPNEDASVTGGNLEFEMERVSKIMEERGDKKGAVILGKEAFAWNYRFIVRFIERYGSVATKLLFALSPTQGDSLSIETIQAFAEVLQKKLRRSDIIFQNRQNQFFIVLPLLSLEDSGKVIDRIMNAWAESSAKEQAELSYAIAFIEKKEET